MQESTLNEHEAEAQSLNETVHKDTNPDASEHKRRPRVKRKPGRPKSSKNKRRRPNFPDASSTVSGQNMLVGDQYVSSACEPPSQDQTTKAHNPEKKSQKTLKLNADKDGQQTHEKNKPARRKRSKNKKSNVRNIRVVALGSGQEVGRSCILLTLNKFNILLDCGMHPGYNELNQKFPDFARLHELTNSSGDKTLTEIIDLVIVTHFHLDHIGALTMLTELHGYRGPIYMTHPTKAMAILALKDFSKLLAEKIPEKIRLAAFTDAMVDRCVARVTGISLHETMEAVSGLRITPYYAGHVLGAAMFAIRDEADEACVVYTGDYNTTPDRHLAGAKIPMIRPDLFITESTYAAKANHGCRLKIEGELLENILATVRANGRVLVPCRSIGPVQDMCVVLDTYWRRHRLKVPIYLSPGMAQKAIAYYQLFAQWSNATVKEQLASGHNAFKFPNIKPIPNKLFHAANRRPGHGDKTNRRAPPGPPGAMVVFCTPGMLRGGASLQLFKQWSQFKDTLVLIPGYCAGGTVGFKLQMGHRRLLVHGSVIDVKCQVKSLSFECHTDADGIMRCIRMCRPRNVLLVHGEKAKMAKLSDRIDKELKLPCSFPANFEEVRYRIPYPGPSVPTQISHSVIGSRTWSAVIPLKGWLVNTPLGVRLERTPDIDKPCIDEFTMHLHIPSTALAENKAKVWSAKRLKILLQRELKDMQIKEVNHNIKLMGVWLSVIKVETIYPAMERPPADDPWLKSLPLSKIKCEWFSALARIRTSWKRKHVMEMKRLRKILFKVGLELCEGQSSSIHTVQL